MNLTKENYEFLMFELLEGNLSETEKISLLEQINKDAFYSQEWTLMQHSVILPDYLIEMPEKQNLLKPEGNKTVYFTYIARIAASLLLIGAFGWGYYIYTNQANNITKTSTRNPKKAILKNNPDDLQQPQPIVKKSDGYVAPSSSINYSKINQVENLTQDIDSLPASDLLEITVIKPIEKEGIAYSFTQNQVIPLEPLNLEKTVLKGPSKMNQLIVQAGKIRTTTKRYWNDIPNLRFKITPKFKERNIGFELKGETIYANAIIQIK